MFISINPFDGKLIREYPQTDNGKLEMILESSFKTYQTWRSSSLEERAQVLNRWAKSLRANAGCLATLITKEMGKPITQAQSEVLKSADLCDHLAENLSTYLSAEELGIGTQSVSIDPSPLGVLYSITPWNFPIWQMVRFAAPAIAAGNTVIVKPAPNVLGVSLELVETLSNASGYRGLYQAIAIDHEQSDLVIADNRISGVALTGGERAGAAVAQVAGRNLKKVVLELGGSDPFIVLGDADIETAAKVGAQSRFMNAGQVCIAAKRFLIEESVFSKFRSAFLDEINQFEVGDPMNEKTFLGPMAREDLRSSLRVQVETSINMGARKINSGVEVPERGFYHPPLVIEDAPEASPILNEEVFGPVATLVSVPDADTAIKRANETKYGLSSSVWTKDTERALALAKRIDAGGVFINALSRSQAEVPIGGIKASGFGRELGRDGLREFVNLKSVWTPLE